MSGFNSFQIIRTGLLGSQRALETVGKNIANANNKGYSREEVLFAAAEPIHVINGIGRGLSAAQVVRYRDEFLDRQFRTRNAWSGFYSTQSGALEKMEQILGDLGDGGIHQSLEAFWGAWKNLAVRPSDLTAKQGIISAAQNFLDEAKRAFDGLYQLRQDLEDQVQQKVALVNQAATQLADLNRAILAGQASSESTHDLADRRDQLIDSLAQLAGASAILQPDGTTTVYIGSLPLVDGGSATTIQLGTALEGNLDTPPLTSTQQVISTLPWNATTTWNVTSGEIGALLQVRDQTIPAYMKDLDTLVRTVATEVNRVHRDDGTGVPDPAIPDIFTINNTWMDITLDPAVAGNPAAIWPHGVLPSGTPGPSDGDRARAIANLGDQQIFAGNLTPRDFLRGVSTKLGFAVRDAGARAEAAALQVEQAELQRANVSGVSIDEEMTKMIQYQQSYNAAARVMTTVDEMLDILINRVGLVGR
jgi:flagellar hook-associated protein 1 FlgK